MLFEKENSLRDYENHHSVSSWNKIYEVTTVACKIKNDILIQQQKILGKPIVSSWEEELLKDVFYWNYEGQRQLSQSMIQTGTYVYTIL